MVDSVRNFYAETDPTRKPSNATRDSRTVLTQFEQMQVSRFLDIGCYDGSNTIKIAKQIGTKDIYGVDFLTDRLGQAQELGIQVEIADLNTEKKLPYPDNYFDVIFLGDVIEHVFSPDFILQEIRRLLCPGAYAVITTPNLASWRNRIALVLGWQPFPTEVSTRFRVGNPRSPKGYPSGHIRVFTPRALKELIEIYDLRVEFLSGFIIRGSRTGLTVFTGLIDDVFERIDPILCDELVVKARKPLK